MNGGHPVATPPTIRSSKKLSLRERVQDRIRGEVMVWVVMGDKYSLKRDLALASLSLGPFHDCVCIGDEERRIDKSCGFGPDYQGCDTGQPFFAGRYVVCFQRHRGVAVEGDSMRTVAGLRSCIAQPCFSKRLKIVETQPWSLG